MGIKSSVGTIQGVMSDRILGDECGFGGLGEKFCLPTFKFCGNVVFVALKASILLFGMMRSSLRFLVLVGNPFNCKVSRRDKVV